MTVYVHTVNLKRQVVESMCHFERFGQLPQLFFRLNLCSVVSYSLAVAYFACVHGFFCVSTNCRNG